MLPNQADAKVLSSKRMLVVDDDTVSRIFLRELLTPLKAEQSFVKNGYEVLKFLDQNQTPDLILLDVKLPDYDGIELAKLIMSKYPGVVIVAETAYSIEGIENRCAENGIRGCVFKPIQKDRFIDTILKAVQ